MALRTSRGRPRLVDEVRVEVADLADAVAAQLERVRARAEPVLAGVEVGAPGVQRVRLAVGHDHLGAGGAVEHRPPVEAHVVQDEPFLRVDRRAQRPAMPADLVALDGEADALGLRDGERPQVVALRDDAGPVRAVRLGDRLDVRLLELEHAAFVDVHVGDQALDRMRVAVVALVPAEVRDRASDPATALHVEPEAARGEHVDLHEGDVLHAAAPHRLAPAGVGAHGLGGRLVVLGRDGRARAGHDAPGQHSAGVEVAHELLHAAVAVDRDRERAAHRPVTAGEPGEVVGLGRLVQPDGDEAGALEPRAHELGSALELARREWLERMCSHMLDRHAATIAAARSRRPARSSGW